MVQRKFEKVNSKKYQFMLLVKTPRQTTMLNINQIKVEESQKVVLLGLTIDNRLTFKDILICYVVLLIINFMH